MNYRKQFEKCFEWIDMHLKEHITVADLACEIGYTVYHFCRIFYAYQGMTPMEYVLNRRLQAALVEIANGRKIIDIAYDYGFETASGFSKAVKLRYGKTPTQLKKCISLDKQNELIDNIFILTEIKEIKSFEICGYYAEMNFSAVNYTEDIIAYWNTFEENNIEEQLYKDLNPYKHCEIGITIRNTVNSGKHKYLLGVIKGSGEENNSWYTYKISGGKYAVITTPPVDMTVKDEELSCMVKKVWKYIFDKWFEDVDFQFDETREAFEYYDERCHYRKDAVMNIYIPIKD